jgi:hypothetical protein
MSKIFKAPSMPAPPPIVMPKVEDVPQYEDTVRKDQIIAAQRAADAKRKGRASTILTGTGLNDSPQLQLTTLLGG